MKKINYIEDFAKWEADFSFYTTIRVRFSETDMFGHVNNVTPFIYFEQARIEFLEQIGLFSKLTNSTSIPVTADLQCDYIKQIFFPDELKVYVKVNQIGNTSMDIHYLGKNSKNDVCFTGRGRLVNVHIKTGEPIPFTEEEKRVLLQQNQ